MGRSKGNLASGCCLLVLLCFSCRPQVQIVPGASAEGQSAFRIETSSATFVYQDEAGGFSNIVDDQGRDWIQFHATDSAHYPASAAADYRGLPNLVFRSDDGGCGHPGFTKMTSQQLSNNQIRSTAKSGRWQWTWTFHNHHAELTVEKWDPTHAFWFLYEGPIAGQFSPSTHYWGTDGGGPNFEQPDLVLGTHEVGQWQTAYFGDRQYDRTFFVHQLEGDTLVDYFAYMGNSEEGNEASDGMVVFGFGRGVGAKPLLQGPHKFICGFYPDVVIDEAGHQRIMSYIHQLP